MLYRQITASSEAVTLVGLAPQTNLATLLTMYPEVIANLDRIVFMGGSAGIGNVTAVAEFNVWQDPEAATCVIESPVPTAMYGLDVFTRLAVDRQPPPVHGLRTPGLGWPASCSTTVGLGRTGRALRGLIGDAGALVYLTNPELFTARHLPVQINLSGIGRGQTIVDQRPVAQDEAAWADEPWPRIDVVLDADLNAAAEAFTATLDAMR